MVWGEEVSEGGVLAVRAGVSERAKGGGRRRSRWRLRMEKSVLVRVLKSRVVASLWRVFTLLILSFVGAGRVLAKKDVGDSLVALRFKRAVSFVSTLVRSMLVCSIAARYGCKSRF